MKQLFALAFIFALLPAKISAQSYVPFIQQGKTWQVWNSDLTLTCNYQSANHFFFNGDSLINNVSYKKLDYYPVVTQFSPGLFCPPYWIDPSITKAGMLIREDTSLRKVYVLNYDSTESVLFNFNLSVGDTIFPCMDIVTSITPDTLLNGTIVHKTTLNNGEFFIESIGGSKAFFSCPQAWITQYANFNCVAINGTQIYEGIPPSGFGCLGFVGLEENNQLMEPIFLTGNNCIQLKNPDQYRNYHLDLYDLSGRKIAYGNQNESIICLPGETVSGAVFIVRLIDENGIMQRKISWQN